MQAVIERVDPRIIFWLCLLAALGITPFLVYHIVTGNFFMLAIVGSLDLMLAVVAWECWHTRRAPARGLLASAIIGAVVVLLAGIHLEMAGVIWSYPYIGFAYYFLGHRAANWVVGVFCPAVAITSYAWATPEQFPRIVATLALTWLFSLVFAVNNHRQRLELTRLAISDPLTGVANRREMYLELGRARHQYERHGTPASLIVLDIDHFKKINDTRGHDVGDAVLIDLVAVLNQRLRDSDRLFRIGGEEFVVLLPLTSLDNALKVAESLRDLVDRSTLGGVQEISISSGVAALVEGEDVGGWIKRADAALYRAKHQGRNRVETALAEAARAESESPAF